MKYTVLGEDLILVNEDTFLSSEPTNKVHLIKFAFDDPTEDKIHAAIDVYKDTNRFVISNNIKFYNSILKNTNKKYYVQNSKHTQGLISFFKKNNKVLLSVPTLKEADRMFILRPDVLSDVLRNLEILMIERKDFEKRKNVFSSWSGNVILYDNVIHSMYL